MTFGVFFYSLTGSEDSKIVIALKFWNWRHVVKYDILLKLTSEKRVCEEQNCSSFRLTSRLFEHLNTASAFS